MGALTLKSFPFELRGWDIEKFESIDPTDSFGTQTRVYISKNQIVQIEPDYDAQTNNTWLSDKGRQFFDEIFETCEVNEKEFFLQTNSGSALMNSLFKTLYIFDHCNRNNSKNDEGKNCQVSPDIRNKKLKNETLFLLPIDDTHCFCNVVTFLFCNFGSFCTFLAVSWSL